MIYSLAKDLQLGVFKNSTVSKFRYIMSYFLVANVSFFTMPIKTYQSMIMTEFYIVNIVFLTYTFTYPLSYSQLLQLVYELLILVIINNNIP